MVKVQTLASPQQATHPYILASSSAFRPGTPRRGGCRRLAARRLADLVRRRGRGRLGRVGGLLDIGSIEERAHPNSRFAGELCVVLKGDVATASSDHHLTDLLIGVGASDEPPDIGCVAHGRDDGRFGDLGSCYAGLRFLLRFAEADRANWLPLDDELGVKLTITVGDSAAARLEHVSSGLGRHSSIAEVATLANEQALQPRRIEPTYPLATSSSAFSSAAPAAPRIALWTTRVNFQSSTRQRRMSPTLTAMPLAAPRSRRG